jgi:hypothetical protein
MSAAVGIREDGVWYRVDGTVYGRVCPKCRSEVNAQGESPRFCCWCGTALGEGPGSFYAVSDRSMPGNGTALDGERLGRERWAYVERWGTPSGAERAAHAQWREEVAACERLGV